MRNLLVSFAAGLAVSFSALADGLNMDWAYHDGNNGEDNRASETVPTTGFAFLGNGTTTIKNDEPVYIYVLTANNFAGDKEEQVFSRWWNGETENWVMGTWVTNVYLGAENGTFHGLPENTPVMLDLWKIEISPDMTKPGDNYYVIQIKGWQEGNSTEAYLLRDSSAEDAHNNNLGQSWTSSGGYIDHDWMVTISE